MKRYLFLPAFLFLSFLSRAQMTDDNSSKGLYGGVSLGYFHYNTHWYYHGSGNPYYDNNAAHSLNRLVVSLDLEKKAVWKSPNLRFDLGGELLLGPTGKAKADYLSGDNTISSGGWSAGLNLFGRLAYNPSSPTAGGVHILPFVSLGPQYMFLHNNGKGNSPAIDQYDYSGGWNEGIILLAASAGVEFQFDAFALTPEFRFGLFGWNSSSWEPQGRDVTMNGGPGFIAFSIRISRHL
jgi:hypothetical protein